MCLPYLKDKAESFSDNIVRNTPNGLILLNEKLEVQQINKAALKIMNLRSPSDILGDGVVRVLDPQDFLTVLQTGRNIHDKPMYLAEYDKYVEETIIYDKEYRLLICIMRDVTQEETVREQVAIVNRKLPLHKRIRRVMVRTEPFPRTASGKIKIDRAPASSVPHPAADIVVPMRERVAAAAWPVIERAVTGVRRTLAPERWKWVVLGLGVLAGVVVLWNVFGAAVLELVEETSAVRRVLEIVEDRLGEVLAVLVLVAAVAIWRTGVFKSDKSTGEKNP